MEIKRKIIDYTNTNDICISKKIENTLSIFAK